MAADRLNEYWDIYNRDLQITGRRQRREALQSGEYHLVVDAFIFNEHGQVLLQQRSSNKIHFPGYWDCSVGGSAVAGESIEAAMNREIAEELGLIIPVTAADNFLIVPHTRWIEAWFAFQTTESVTHLALQHEELQRVAFFDQDAAQRHLHQVGFNPYTVEMQRAWSHLLEHAQ
ncbi:NUDIX domain-containing protein [Levilactobacillus yonginensis]|uniref:NUDIX hydrolase n=1 Tax=Levilactobacillus yonginensis TaxID=1054041 RepID=UPI00345D9B95